MTSCFSASRGLDAEEAVALIVNRFCKDVLQHVANGVCRGSAKLVGISLEGSVG